jgi:Fe-S-cluster containining protein
VLHFAPVECRPGCGACCIAISISSSIPGMPQGKPAGVRCVQLTPENLCALWGLPERPRVCGALRASEDMCGSSFEEACRLIRALEAATATSLPAQEAR